jgi:N-methylhydantoinase A
VDVGGTFTDLALVRAEQSGVVTWKVPSTPRDPAEGILAGLEELLRAEGLAGGDVGFLAHGTTVATNALLERKGAPTGLLTTKGFRDLLEIGRQIRPHLYDLQADKPPPLVPRRLRLEVTERLLADGKVFRPLDLDEARAALATLRETGVEAVAICLLHAYANPMHEATLARLAAEALPEAFVSASHRVVPEFREFERLSTTVLNAYLGPIVSRYVGHFRARVRDLGIAVTPYINQSNGGVISVALAGECPIRTILSGPSAGVMGAHAVARRAGHARIITFDMGGTSTDVCLVEGEAPSATSQRLVEGYPVKTPMLDVHTVGAGGGSIAWVDSGGALKVGPQSAGADPGPAAYDRGGREATVTDAHVLLGSLNPVALLGGRMPIRRDKAEAALGRLGAPVGLGAAEAARGILAVVTANMARAVRVITVQQGRDPREATLVAFGGAGPLHAVSLARELGIRQVLVPEAPGILCAMGLLVEDLRTDFARTRVTATAGATSGQVRGLFDEMETEAHQWFEAEAVPPARRALRRLVDMRYAGQNYELSIPLAWADGRPDLAALAAAFHREHERAYGHAAPDEPTQLVCFRLTAIGRTPPLDLAPARRGPAAGDAVIARRPVWFLEAERPLESPVYARERLEPGRAIAGPALIEQPDATTLLPPGSAARPDEQGNLVIEVG